MILRLGLRERLVVLVLLAVLPFLAILGIAIRVSHSRMEEDARHELLLSAQLLSKSIEEIVGSARALLAAGAVSPMVQGLSPQSCTHHVREILRQNPLYAEIGVVGRDGRIVCTASGRGKGADAGRAAHVAAALKTGRFSVGDYEIGLVSRKPVLALAYPVLGPGGGVAGVLGLSIDLARLDGLVKGLALHPGATFTVVDRRGVVLARVPEGARWTGKPAGGLEVAKTALRGGEGTVAGEGLDGVRRLFAFVPVLGSAGGSGLVVGVGLPESEVFGEAARDLRRGLLAAAAALLLAVSLAAFYAERSILRPLEAVAQAARRLGEGDWSARTGLKGRDEIGVMGRVFDRTAVALGELTRRNRLILENTQEGILFIDAEGKISFANPAVLRLLGYETAELQGAPMHEKVHHSREDGSPFPVEDCPLHALLLAGEGSWRGETVFWRKDGKSLPVDCGYVPVLEKGWVAGAVAVFRDITEQRRLERQLLQSQKLEAMGRLAGGVAHDFNNLLTAILGFSGFLKESLAEGDERRADVAEIENAAQRAAGLTRQLLLFSRNKPSEVKELSLGALVSDQLKLLRRVVGEGVDIRSRIEPGMPSVLGDPAQLEQAVLNLVVNARDAMPGGGVIELEAAQAELPVAEEGLLLQGEGGPQARVTVRDGGVGMDATVLARLFEPFFTTKEVGKGTGLGLSIVYGVVRRHKGSIRVLSAPGKGSEFSLYFPLGKADAPREAAPVPVSSAAGRETLLVVENENAIRAMLRRVLERAGYHVLEAPGLEEALAAASASPRPPDLLLSDVVLSGARGPEVARRLRESLPRLKALYMTGFPGEQADLPQDPEFLLYKPFSPARLLGRVRSALDKK